MKFFAALKQAEFATKLFAAAGLNFEALFTKGDENALKAHLESLKPAGDITALTAKVTALTEETTALNGALASAKKEHDDALAAHAIVAASANLVSAALTAKGVKLPAATADKPVAQADIEAAIDARISTKAREKLAATGHNDPLPVEATADSSKPATSGGKTMSTAEFSALSHKEKMEFSRNGGRLTE